MSGKDRFASLKKSIDDKLTLILNDTAALMKAYNKSGKLNQAKAESLVTECRKTLIPLIRAIQRGDEELEAVVVLMGRQNWLEACLLLILNDPLWQALVKEIKEQVSPQYLRLNAATQKEQKLFADCKTALLKG